jgi:hypothetical protein
VGREEKLEHMKAYCKIHLGTKNNLGILHLLMRRWGGGGAKGRNWKEGAPFLNGIHCEPSRILFAPWG